MSEASTAFYIRTSTGKQKQESQADAIREFWSRRYAKEQERSVRVYNEKVSGAGSSRPVLDTLLQDVRAGKVKRILVYKLDRLGRSLVHLAQIIQEIAKLDVPLVCVSQGIDTSKDDLVGRLQLNVLLAVAEFERELIQERTRAGLAAARSRGKRLGRPPSLMQHTAAVFQLRRQGLATREIARRLKLPYSSTRLILSRLPNSNRRRIHK